MRDADYRLLKSVQDVRAATDREYVNEPKAVIKRMRLRYSGACRTCGDAVPAGEWALYHRDEQVVVCVDCAERSTSAWDPSLGLAGADNARGVSDEVDVESGKAGASARREYERRAAKREGDIRARHPKIGGFLLAMTEEPQSTRAWVQGAVGEERLGMRLDQLRDRGALTLHDRRIPGTRSNIDHIVVSSAGIFVIDAKRYKGRPDLHVRGGFLTPRVQTLRVGGRDCTKLVDVVLRQVDLVRAAAEAQIADVSHVRGMLCFIDAVWPLLGGSFTINGVQVLWPKKAAEAITAQGPHAVDEITRIYRHLATAFPPA